METKLPDKLSDCVLLALKDLAKCGRSPKYNIKMGTWHTPNGACSVCLAGAVIAKSLGVSPLNIAVPWDFSDHNKARLNALDDLRVGDFDMAFDRFVFGRLPAVLTFVAFPEVPYRKDPAAFKRRMRKIARILAKEGL